MTTRVTIGVEEGSHHAITVNVWDKPASAGQATLLASESRVLEEHETETFTIWGGRMLTISEGDETPIPAATHAGADEDAPIGNQG